MPPGVKNPEIAALIDPETGIIPADCDCRSAASLKYFRPDRYQHVVAWLAAGVTTTATSKHFGLDYSVVFDIGVAEGKTIQANKDELASALEFLATKGIVLTIEEMEKIPPEKRMISVGIALDHAAKLRGEPGQIIEHRIKDESKPVREVLAEFIEAATTTEEDTPALPEG